MTLYKTNGEVIEVDVTDIRESWDAISEGCRKVVVEYDDATRITYKVTNDIQEINDAIDNLI